MEDGPDWLISLQRLHQEKRLTDEEYNELYEEIVDALSWEYWEGEWALRHS